MEHAAQLLDARYDCGAIKNYLLFVKLQCNEL